jgi:hypothetical protein
MEALMSGKHAISVHVKGKNGERSNILESKDHGLLNLLNRYHCETTSSKFAQEWSEYCLENYQEVLEIQDINYEWFNE